MRVGLRGSVELGEVGEKRASGERWWCCLTNRLTEAFASMPCLHMPRASPQCFPHSRWGN